MEIPFSLGHVHTRLENGAGVRSATSFNVPSRFPHFLVGERFCPALAPFWRGLMRLPNIGLIEDRNRLRELLN